MYIPSATAGVVYENTTPPLAPPSLIVTAPGVAPWLTAIARTRVRPANAVVLTPAGQAVDVTSVCIAMSLELGLNETQIRDSIASFKGVKRRFEYHIRNAHVVYIDDYAHHPTEIHSFISSVRLMYPHRRIVGAFQPHLFSRTRDFFEAFAHELSALDELVLLPIYPARELPIEGVNSERLLAEIELSKKQLLTAQETLEYLSKQRDCVILTMGAGDIDRIVEPLTKALS